MRKSSIIIIGVFTGALYWFVDVLADVFLFGHGTFSSQVFDPSRHEVWIRLFACLMIISSALLVSLASAKRRRTEDQLQRSEEQYRLVVNNINDIIYLASISDEPYSAKLEMIGGRVEQILGYSPREFLKNSRLWFGILHPDDVSSVREQTENILARRETGTRLYRIRHRTTGEFLWIEDKVMPRFDGSGRVTGFFGVARDISQRRQVEEALREAIVQVEDEKARSEGILDAIADGVSIQDRDYRILYQSKTHRELTGEHVGEFCYKAYQTHSSVCRDCPIKSAFEDGGGHRVERAVPTGTSIRYLEIIASPLRDASGRIIAGIEVVRDITGRKQAELALRESEAKFRTLFEESKDVFYISIPEGKFLDINPAGVELFGYASKQELLSIDIAKGIYVNPLDRKKFIDVVDRTNYAKDYAVQMKRKNGEKLWVIITSTAVRDEQGKIITFRGIIRDVTEHKKLEQQLLQSQKMEAIGLLAGGIAHDFNNILTAIIGYGNLLRKNLKDNDHLRGFAEQVLEASEHATRLTRSILAFSRKQILNPEPVDLNEVIGRVEKFLVRLIGEDIELKAVLKGADLTVMADSGQIEQVLINLATNARDAMPNGGSIIIETAIENPDAEDSNAYGAGEGMYAVISVTDTGMGFDEQIRDRIFEPFFTTKEVGKGTGLGLSIVYGIIEQHGGHVTAESEPGQGTTFKVYLPLLKRKPDQKQVYEPSVLPPAGGSKIVLLAEDDKSVRTLARQILEDAGYIVIEAATGGEAIKKFAENRERIDLVVLDVVMPNKNGKEVYDEIQKLKPGSRALFTSGYTGDIIHKKGILDVGLNFIAKPLSPTEFLQKVHEVLDR